MYMMHFIRLKTAKMSYRGLSILFLLMCLMHTESTLSQVNSGYFGSKHGVEFRAGGTPAYFRSKKIISNGDEYRMKRKRKLLRSSYKLNYSFLAKRNLEFLIGYEYARLRMPGNFYYDDPITSQNLDILQDPKLNKHGMNFHARFYRKGSISPIGKYIGVGFGCHFVRINSEIPIYVGESVGAGSTGGGFISDYSISSLDTVELDKSGFDRFQVVNFNGSIGRSYPLSSSLLLNFNLRVRVLSLYTGTNGIILGSSVGGILDNSSSRINEDDEFIGRRVQEAMHNYHRSQFEIGLKYFF